MSKRLLLLFASVFALSACGTSASGIPIATPALDATTTETPTSTAVPTETPLPPSPTPTATISPALLARPVFLAWPLPATIGTARISQYPNSAWSWHYLGLNAGYECPPMFGYLINLDSLLYWRDTAVPEEQDIALADPHQFEMVECYSPHAGTDIKAPAGTPVYAAADGRVMEWFEPGLNSYLVLKHCLGGNWGDNGQCVAGKQWYTTYMHIIPDQSLLQENNGITQGEPIGTIYDQSINSHLHFAVGIGTRSYETYVNPWGQDKAPWRECMWLDQSLCVNPAQEYKRLAVYTSDERLFIHQGNIEPVEVLHAQGIRQVRLWGDRIGVLDTENNLRLQDGKYDGQSSGNDLLNWQIVAEDVLDFQITDYRIVILDDDEKLWLQEKELGDEWRFLTEDVSAFSLSDRRVGYLTRNGDLFVIEGELENEWVLIQKNVLAFQVIDNRIAYVDQEGKLYVNEGDLLSEFELLAEDVRAFQLTIIRVGIVDLENNLKAMEGNLRADWVWQAEKVQSFQLADYRILMQGEDGSFQFKEGHLYQEWSDLPYADLRWALLNREIMIEVE